MNRQGPSESRALRTQLLRSDFVVIGGGMAGVCCAVTAARAGIKVVLVQDRPVLGGNASSEIRLWTLGATAHMYNNNRWAREAGVINELLVENMWRNPEGNPHIFDTVLLEWVVREPNITLLLNTAVMAVTKSNPDTIEAVTAFCSQNSVSYEISAPLFVDASGDGIVGFLSGAAFRMGAESKDEFGELFAPAQEFGELLGHSLYFYSKDTGQPVQYVAPSFALNDITQIPKFRSFNASEYGCRLWWIEYGGRLDTVHDTEAIKWELWKVVYGVWDYIKNSGNFPESETLTLEWVGHIPGKRESRRFEGDYMLRQQDVIEQRPQSDAVSFGGWALDLHPADGIYSEVDCPTYTHWQAKGVYPIPYRCLYSRNITNLFLAGRIISSSHVAFGSTRVMATCAYAAQAVGMAAALCVRDGVVPRDITQPERMAELQRELMRTGQHIPGFHLEDADDLAQQAIVTTSSKLTLHTLPVDGPAQPLDRARAQMLPVLAGSAPTVTFTVDVSAPTTLRLELRMSERADSFTPDIVLAEKTMVLSPGDGQSVKADFNVTISTPCYLYYCLMPNENVVVRTSESRLTGLLSLAKANSQDPPEGIGVDDFEFWLPDRRPNGQNLAVSITPPLDVFGSENLTNGLQRPTHAPNAWIAAYDDPLPTITLRWDRPQDIRRIELAFDADWDHPMESVLLTHPERVMPFCVKKYRILDGSGKVLAEKDDNHQTLNTISLESSVNTKSLAIQILETHGPMPASVFEVRCYSS